MRVGHLSSLLYPHLRLKERQEPGNHTPGSLLPIPWQTSLSPSPCKPGLLALNGMREGHPGISLVFLSPVHSHRGPLPQKTSLEKHCARVRAALGHKSGNELRAKVVKRGRKPVCCHKGVRKEKEQTAKCLLPPLPASHQPPPACPTIQSLQEREEKDAETLTGHPLKFPALQPQWQGPGATPRSLCAQGGMITPLQPAPKAPLSQLTLLK